MKQTVLVKIMLLSIYVEYLLIIENVNTCGIYLGLFLQSLGIGGAYPDDYRKQSSSNVCMYHVVTVYRFEGICADVITGQNETEDKMVPIQLVAK